MSLPGKVVWVTGSTTGIGEGIVRMCLEVNKCNIILRKYLRLK